MNKRELVNWLENKKQEVLRANDAYYEETIKKEQERLLQERKFYEMAQKVQQCLNQAVQIWSDWKRANDDNKNMRIDLGYNDVTRSLYSLTRSEDEVAKRLHISTVAEGIETAEHVQLMREMHCDYGQGYYYSKPIPAERFTKTFLIPNAQSAEL